MEVKVAFWDLNFYLSDDDGWVLCAYPFDENDEPIGGQYKMWARFLISSYEASKLRLGHTGNLYSSDEDFWIGLELFLNDYHNQCESVRVRLGKLPDVVDTDVSGVFYTDAEVSNAY